MARESVVYKKLPKEAKVSPKEEVMEESEEMLDSGEEQNPPIPSWDDLKKDKENLLQLLQKERMKSEEEFRIYLLTMMEEINSTLKGIGQALNNLGQIMEEEK